MLMRRFHDASRTIDLTGFAVANVIGDPDVGETTWSRRWPTRGGPIICHNDVCLENVVFRGRPRGRARRLRLRRAGPARLRPRGDARMCVPINDDVGAEQLGWRPADLARRGSDSSPTAMGSTARRAASC